MATFRYPFYSALDILTELRTPHHLNENGQRLAGQQASALMEVEFKVHPAD
jgi:hypothetical protein